MSQRERAGGVGVRVVLAEDSALFREGIARILTASGFDVVAQTGDHDALIAAVEAHRPDVVVTDIRMPPTGTTEGLAAARTIRTRWPKTAVLVLSHYVESRYAVQLLEQDSGGVGYLLKDRVADGAEFANAVRRLSQGDSVIDPEVVAGLLRTGRYQREVDRLTAREHEILAAMAEGRSNRAISESLRLSPKTVESHVSSIFVKLGLEPTADDHRRVLAVLAYLRAN